MDNMDILQFVPDALPAARADVAVLFGKYLPREGVHCHIVGRSTSESMHIDQGFASVSRARKHNIRLRQEFEYLLLCTRVLLGVKRSKIDLLQVRDMVTIGLFAALIARFKGIPYTYWMSYLMSEGRKERAMVAGAWRSSLRSTIVWVKGAVEEIILYRLVLPLSSHIFVQSDAMRDYVSKRGIPATRITPVPMGVDTEQLTRESICSRRIPGWENIPIMAYLGSLELIRQPWVLIDTLAIVRKHHPLTRLLLVGTAESKAANQRILDYADQRGLLESVHVTGWLAAHDAWSLICGADVAISYVPRSPLFDVSSPTKLLEYLALALPSIGNDNPDQAVVLGMSRAGWLTKSDAQSLSTAASEILDDPVRAAERAAQGPSGINTYRSYRILAQQVAQRYFSLRLDQE